MAYQGILAPMQSEPTFAELKKTIRSEALKRRDSIPGPVRKVKDASIRRRLLGLEVFKGARSVLLYASFRSEVDTLALIGEALASGKRVMLPRVAGEVLELYEVERPEEISPGFMGIPEPAADDRRRRGLGDVDMVVVPGAAFDPRGWRLGYGKGYYDRLLSASPGTPRVALAYEEQIVEDLPHEEHDMGMHEIVTDKRVIDCHGQGKD
jgi:5-formyltetrahydrofolate cyclo-ligase